MDANEQRAVIAEMREASDCGMLVGSATLDPWIARLEASAQQVPADGECAFHAPIEDRSHEIQFNDGLDATPQAPQPESREARMVVVERDANDVPTVWCDPEIADLVTALNAGGIRTIASCSGHGEQNGNIALADGRELIIAPDYESARRLEALALSMAAAIQPQQGAVALPEHEGDTCYSSDVYAGNSVGWWKSKADNYGAGLLKVCDALGRIGVKMDGSTPCWEYVEKLHPPTIGQQAVDDAAHEALTLLEQATYHDGRYGQMERIGWQESAQKLLPRLRAALAAHGKGG